MYAVWLLYGSPIAKELAVMVVFFYVTQRAKSKLREAELGVSRGAAAFSREKLSVLCVEGTLLEGRDSVVWRARDGGWGECLQGDGTNSFCA